MTTLLHSTQHPSHSLPFRDTRAPHEIQAHFEQLWTTVLTPELVQDQLIFKTSKNVLGAPYTFQIQYEGRTFWKHVYTLQVTIHLSRIHENQQDYYRKNFQSWLDFWTSKLDACEPVLSSQVHTLPYSKTVQETLAVEAQLHSIPTLQQLILTGLHEGMLFSTSHKEGGTIIRYRSGIFLSSDYGESNAHQSFTDPLAFLNYLKNFFEWSIVNAYAPSKPSEYQIWRLIYRMLHTQ